MLFKINKQVWKGKKKNKLKNENSRHSIAPHEKVEKDPNQTDSNGQNKH